MSGLLRAKIALAAPMIASLMGCARDNSGWDLNEFKGYPPAEPERGSSTVDDIHITAPPPRKSAQDGPGFRGQFPPAEEALRFRDYAAYSWFDRGGSQWLSQTLLVQDGRTYFTRTCPIDRRDGVLWAQCDPWSPGLDIEALGLGTASASGLGAFTFDDPSTGRPLLVQTALSLNGALRLGRACPIADKYAQLTMCTPWSKFEVLAIDLGVFDQPSFRDQDTFTFVDSNGQTQFMNRLLSSDGSQSWTQTCTTASEVVEATKECEFSQPVAVSSWLDIPNANAVSSFGGYVYVHNGDQVYAETAISMDGTQTAHRECPVDPVAKSIDQTSCTRWMYASLATILKSPDAPL